MGDVRVDMEVENVEIVEGDDESDFSDDCQMDFDGIKDLWVRKQRKPPWVEGPSALWSTVHELIALPGIFGDLLHPLVSRMRLFLIFPVRRLHSLLLNLIGRPRSQS